MLEAYFIIYGLVVLFLIVITIYTVIGVIIMSHEDKKEANDKYRKLLNSIRAKSHVEINEKDEKKRIK